MTEEGAEYKAVLFLHELNLFHRLFSYLMQHVSYKDSNGRNIPRPGAPPDRNPLIGNICRSALPK